MTNLSNSLFKAIDSYVDIKITSYLNPSMVTQKDIDAKAAKLRFYIERIENGKNTKRESS